MYALYCIPILYVLHIARRLQCPSNAQQKLSNRILPIQERRQVNSSAAEPELNLIFVCSSKKFYLQYCQTLKVRQHKNSLSILKEYFLRNNNVLLQDYLRVYAICRQVLCINLFQLLCTLYIRHTYYRKLRTAYISLWWGKKIMKLFFFLKI